MTATPKTKNPHRLLNEPRGDRKERRESGPEANSINAAYRFLIEFGTALNNSLDEEDTLRAIATLAIPILGDWSVIDVLGKDGSIRRIPGIHRDTCSQPFLRALQCRNISPLNKHPAVNYAFEVPRLRILTDLLDFFRPITEQDAVYRMTLLAVGFGSCLVLPLVARGRVLAVVSVVSMQTPSYQLSHLALAEAFARQAAQGLDNARRQQDGAAIRRELRDRIRMFGA